MGNRGEAETSRRLPERMFASGEEPVGVRVTPYHKPFAITDIIRALDEEELQHIRQSPFRKLLEIAEKPSFSGRFGRYLLSRQLKVNKKYEAWFLFAGKPIRFSLREFAIVTGLNCGKFPGRVKRKTTRAVNERPYWAELFGTLNEVPVTSVVRMLKSRSVTDKETRIKYAYLSLLAAVVLPTTHIPRISHEHAEKIKDLESFLAYPWGRVSFKLLISSIKERNEVSLSQNTIALKGFVLALQLVMIEAVPALTEVIPDGSEDEFSEGEEHVDDDGSGKRSICPAHARETDVAAKALVVSIISSGKGDSNCETEFAWSDDDIDYEVDYLVTLVNDGFIFKPDAFTGGCSKTDVEKMRQETKNEAEGRKRKKNKANECSSDIPNAQSIATEVKAHLSEDINRIADDVHRLCGDVSTMATDMRIFRAAFSTMEATILGSVEDMLKKFETEIMKKVCNSHNESPSKPMEEEDDPFSGDAGFPLPTRNGGGFVVDEPVQGQNAAPTEEVIVSSCWGTKPPQCDVIIENAIRFADTMAEGVQGDRNPTPASADVPPSRRTLSPQTMRFQRATNLGPPHVLDEPDFSLGLTQEEAVDGRQRLEGVENVSGDVDVTNQHDVPVVPFQNATTLGPPHVLDEPDFSLGLTQEEVLNGTQRSEGGEKVSSHVDVTKQPELPVEDVGGPALQFRKSKRQKVVPKGLMGVYECDKKFLTRAWEAHVGRTGPSDDIAAADKQAKLREMLKKPFSFMANGVNISSKDITTLLEKSGNLPSKVVDVLIDHTRSVYDAASSDLSTNRAVFFDTKFVAQLSKTFGRFSKVGVKEGFKFPATLWGPFKSCCPSVETASRFYFPFNYDKTHWVGLCIDATSSDLTVLDCNVSNRSDVRMFKELGQFAEMFPHLLQQSGKQHTVREMKTLSIERPRSVPQIPHPFYSPVTAVLLLQAHAFGGVEMCKCITPTVVDSEVERLAVTIVDTNHGIK